MMTVTYDIQADFQNGIAEPKNLLCMLSGIQKVIFNRKKNRITIKYDGDIASIELLKHRLQLAGFRLSHELYGGTFERMGAVLTIYQKERQVFL